MTAPGIVIPFPSTPAMERRRRLHGEPPRTGQFVERINEAARLWVSLDGEELRRRVEAMIGREGLSA